MLTTWPRLRSTIPGSTARVTYDEPRAVRLDHLLPLVKVGLLGGLEPERQAGVVDEHVDLGERRRERRDELLDGDPVPDIEG